LLKKQINLEIETKNVWLSNQQNQLIRALDSSSLLSIADSKGIIIYVNKPFCEISGYTEQELLGQNHRILKSGEQSNNLFKGMWAAISSKRIWRGEVCNKRKDGSFYWVNATIIPFLDEHNNIEKYVSVRYDITKHKNGALIQKQLYKNFYNIFEGSSDAIIISDIKTGRIIKSNSKARMLLGYTIQDFKNMTLDSLYYQKDLFKANVKAEKPSLYEVQYVLKSGEPIDVEVSSRRFMYNQDEVYQSNFRDITDRKERQKALKEKTDELEVFLYRSGHDLRAPFTSMEGLIDILKTEEGITDNALEIINMIESTLKSGKILVDNLSTASNTLSKGLEIDKIDLESHIQQTLLVLSQTSGYDEINFNINIPKNLIIKSNKGLLGSVFQNLIQNAIKYRRPATKNHTPFIIVNTLMFKNEVEIQIKDNGIGINKEELNKVFDLHFRSRTTIAGCGLGLYITKNSVNKLNGKIEVESVINKGTTIKIRLPKEFNHEKSKAHSIS